MKKDPSKNAGDPDMGPEAGLLLCCARVRVDDDHAREIARLAQQGLDWPRLLVLSRKQGLLPLLYSQLGQACPDIVPPAWMAQLQAESRRVTQRNLQLTAELLRVVELFQAAGLRVIPFKGPTVAACLYGDLSLRQFGDLDFIVAQREILKAGEILLRAGYEAVSQRPGQLPWDLPGIPEQYLFRTPDRASLIELHTEVTLRHFPVPFDFDVVWERKRELLLGGQSVSILSPEDLLCLLCVHGAKDHWEQLKWICDIAELIAPRRELNWQEALSRAGRWRIRRFVLLGVYLAERLLGAELPEQIAAAIQSDRAVPALYAQVYAPAVSLNPAALPSLSRLLFRFRLVEGFWPGVSYSLRLATTPIEEDWSAVSLPPSFHFLYRAVRVFRAVKEHALVRSQARSCLSRVHEGHNASPAPRPFD